MVTIMVKILTVAFFVSAAHCMMVRSTSDDPMVELLENYNATGDENADFRLVTLNDIGLWFYSQKTGIENPVKVSSDHCSRWKEEGGFDSSKKTVFVTHGFLGSGNTFACQEPIKAFLDAGHDYNLVVMDWGNYSQGYFTALAKLKEIGYLFAVVTERLEEECNLDLDNCECVGHSLGSHVCGFMGEALNGRLGKIVALDPAAPAIGEAPDKRVDVTDAKCVQVIHSSSGGLSIKKPMGHADFYPCGAKNQWGCDPDLVENVPAGCDHNACPKLYAQSIMHPGLFTADCECASGDDAMGKVCMPHEVSADMGHHEKGCQYGIFYLDTYKCYEKILNE